MSKKNDKHTSIEEVKEMSSFKKFTYPLRFNHKQLTEFLNSLTEKQYKYATTVKKKVSGYSSAEIDQLLMKILTSDDCPKDLNMKLLKSSTADKVTYLEDKVDEIDAINKSRLERFGESKAKEETVKEVNLSRVQKLIAEHCPLKLPK